MWNGMVSQPRVTIRNQEEYLGCGGPLEEREGPSPTPGSPAQDSRVERSPHNSGCENHQRLWLGETGWLEPHFS